MINIECNDIGLASIKALAEGSCKILLIWVMKYAAGLGLMMMTMVLARLRSSTWYIPVCRIRHGFPDLTSFFSEYLYIQPNSDDYQ